MKKIILTLIPTEEHYYQTCLLAAQKFRKQTIIGYANVKIEEIEDKGERMEE